MRAQKASGLSLRYVAGYSCVRLASFVRRPIEALVFLGTRLEQFATIIWTRREIDRYSRHCYWNSRRHVQEYANRAEQPDWLGDRERILIQKYFLPPGEVLNLACGAGREAWLLARQGHRVTACDWSPGMIAAARSRFQESGLPIRFQVVDLYNLPYADNAFDYLLLTNIAYSYVIPRRRRIHFLEQAYSLLKPGGSFILSFAPAVRGQPGSQELLHTLFMTLRRFPLFNQEYERGDRMVWGSLVHFFRPNEVQAECAEAGFLVKEQAWEQGFAVLSKA